jgi:hypothetical protein
MDNESLVLLAQNIPDSQADFLVDALRENEIESISAAHYSRSGKTGYSAVRVKKKDQERSIKVMIDLGYEVFNEDEEEQKFFEMLASPTQKIPLLAKYSLTVRLLIMLGFIASLITLLAACFFAI